MSPTRRDWFAVQCRLIRHPKYRGLDDEDQLTLLYLWAIAGDETPEATWGSVERLEALLRLSGRPAGSVPRLIAAGWLDIGPGGSIIVHDWDEHQYAATAEAKRTYEAARLQRWRRGRAGPPPPDPYPDRASQHSTAQGYVRERTPTAGLPSEPDGDARVSAAPSREQAAQAVRHLGEELAKRGLPQAPLRQTR